DGGLPACRDVVAAPPRVNDLKAPHVLYVGIGETEWLQALRIVPWMTGGLQVGVRVVLSVRRGARPRNVCEAWSRRRDLRHYPSRLSGAALGSRKRQIGDLSRGSGAAHDRLQPALGTIHGRTEKLDQPRPLRLVRG